MKLMLTQLSTKLKLKSKLKLSLAKLVSDFLVHLVPTMHKSIMFIQIHV